MDRRRFVLGSAGMVLLGSGRIEAEAAGEVTVKVDAEYPGIAIAADFVGLSYEAAVLASSEYFNPNNRSVLGLMRELGSNGVLRIGGNTSERTAWQFSQAGDPTNTYIIKPEAIDALAAFLQALGWRLIYGLNLARGTPDEAAEEAAYVARAVGSRLLALQISNEPDGFGRWSAVRPPGYDAAAFVREWLTFYNAVRTRVPNAAFAGPDVAAETGWVPIFAEAVPGGLVMITRHYYSDGPAGSPKVSLTKLLRSAPQLEAVLSELQGYGRRYQLPFRIAETNSVFDNGRPGVSDTLGAALWGIETMFQVASAGGVGINFHAGDDKVYTPIGPGAAGRHQARPLYYAMLMFAVAARDGALVPATLNAGNANLAAYAVRANDGTLRVCLINKDSQAVHVQIDPGRSSGRASVLRMVGPALDAATGITLGDDTISDFGDWSAKSLETAERIDPGFIIVVPATSAAIISIETA